MDPVDLDEERRDEERQDRRAQEALDKAGLVLCPNCLEPIDPDDRRRCDATNVYGVDCGRQGCRHCIAEDSAGNHYCGPECGIAIYKELLASERKSHRSLMQWYYGRIAALEKQT